MKHLRFRHKATIFCPLILAAICVVGRWREGERLGDAVISIWTLIALGIGLAIGLGIWALAAWFDRLDKDAPQIDLEELIEMATVTPASRYVDGLVEQLSKGDRSTWTIRQSEHLPPVAGLKPSEMPAFGEVEGRLMRMRTWGESRGGQEVGGPIELMVHGQPMDLHMDCGGDTDDRWIQLEVRAVEQ